MIFTHDISPVLAEIGPLTIRWYGLLFASGVLLNYLILRWIFKRKGEKAETLDSIAIYLFVGLLVGARLGEVFFYEPSYFFANPVSIFKIWEGGLSSHGAAIGLFFSYLIWVKIHKVSFARYADLLVIPMPLTAFFVRMGNFFNSEIVGKATGGDFGVVFSRLGEDFPRHPAQLYEGIWSLIVFIVLIVLEIKTTSNFGRRKPLFFLFLYIFLYFSGRFFIEFFKDVNSLPTGFVINTGQLLSLIPVLIATIYFTIFYKKTPASRK